MPNYEEVVKLTSTEYTTLSELQAKLFGKDSPIARLTYEYAVEQTLGAMLPVATATGRMDDESPFLEPWEYNKNSHTTDLDSGARYSKVGTYKRKDILGMRESAIGINKKQYKMQGALGNWWRAEQSFDRAKKIGLDNEHDMFWGDPRQDPKSFLGLFPRFQVITDMYGIVQAGDHKGEKSPYITLDAGGTTDGALSSVYLIYPNNKDGVCWLIPGKDADYQYGVEYDPGEFVRIKTIGDSGEPEALDEATDIFRVCGGIGMRNRLACIRIANVDISTEAGFKKLRRCIREANEAVSPSISNGFIGFTSSGVKLDILDQYENLVKPASYNEAQSPKIDKGAIMLDGQKIMSIVHLNDGEEKVV